MSSSPALHVCRRQIMLRSNRRIWRYRSTQRQDLIEAALEGSHLMEPTTRSDEDGASDPFAPLVEDGMPHASLLADTFGSPSSSLTDPIDHEFIESSEEGYGELVDIVESAESQLYPSVGSASDAWGDPGIAGDGPTDTDAPLSAAEADSLAYLRGGADDGPSGPVGPPSFPYLSEEDDESELDPDEAALADVQQEGSADDAAARALSEGGPSGRGRSSGILGHVRQHPARTVVVALLAILIVVSVVVAIVVNLGPPDKEEGTQTAAPYTTPSAAPQSTPSSPGGLTGVPAGDGPIGIRSATARCGPGSTSEMNAFDGAPDNAWKCILPIAGTPGQVLRVEFDAVYSVSGVAIVPGFQRVNTDGSDEWLKHLTVSKVSYQFNDKDARGKFVNTRYTQETLSSRSGAQTAITPPLIASAMTITVLGFAAPSGSAGDAGASPTGAAGTGSLFGPTQPSVENDVTKFPDFAVSSIVIIGHKAR